MTNKEAKLEEDKLSVLPDTILIHILSFLPTDEAIKTVLLRRFGTLWTYLPILNFDDSLLTHLWPPDEEINTTFFQFVHNVLTLHQRPTLDCFRVDISTVLYTDIKPQNLRHELDSWLTFALRKRVKVLEFGFGMVEPDNELYELPFIVFLSDSIFKLKLLNIEMKLQKRVQMGSLRVLKLVYVSLNDDVFRQVIRGCPLLKEIEISNCWDLTEVDSPTLDVLKLDREMIAGEEIMKINCPELSSFNYTGCVNGLEIMNLSSLAHFVFNLSFTITEQEFKEFNQFQYVLSKFLHAKSVTLSSEFVTVLFSCILKDLSHVMFDWKLVELNILLTHKHVSGLFHLLKNLLHLEKLVLNVTFWHSDYLKAVESEMDGCSLEKEEYCWSSLKTIVICNISECLYTVLVRLVEILLKSSPVLDKLVIYCKDNDKTEQLAEFSKKLPTFAKASPTVKVLLI
ncbi:hypothetical protein BVRB_6g135730 [Beta vulgaris subsp. vulgaris]|nr:hypothetical protein BVRB_6g135730 [Beta vulgaris subsp. vulgaris]